MQPWESDLVSWSFFRYWRGCLKNLRILNWCGLEVMYSSVLDLQMRNLKPASIQWLVHRQKWYTVTVTTGVSGLLPITVPRTAPLPLSSCVVFHLLSQNTSWIERWCVVGGSHLWSSFAWSFDQDKSSVTMGWEGWAELQFSFSFSFFLLACFRCSYLHKETTYWAFSKYTLCWKKRLLLCNWDGAREIIYMM